MNKKLVLVLAVLLIVILVFSCMTFAAKKIVIGYATKSSTSPYWVQLDGGAAAEAKKLGVELIRLGPPKENDIVGQVAVIEDLINRGVSALVIAPCDSVGVGPVVEKANKKNIPVVAVDTSIQGGKIVTFVATDNIKAAEMAAAFMGKRLKGKGNIVLLNGMISQGSGKERYEGFRDYAAKNFPGLKIVAAVAADWNEEKALKGMEDAIQANPQIDGVFVGWDGAALMAYKALTEAKRKAVICGFDCFKESCQLMKDGTMFEADISQFPVKMGAEAIKAAVDAASGKTVNPRIDTGTMIVDKTNVVKYAKDTYGIDLK
jgi:ribose transport system substrate-binding protein